MEVRPVEGQIDDLVGEVNKEVRENNKILITTLTKRMAEELTDYMKDLGIRVQILHSDIDTLERTEIIRDMRLDVFDVLVESTFEGGTGYSGNLHCGDSGCGQRGIPAFRDLSDSDNRRAARNAEGHVIMYADVMTDSMKMAIDETMRRRSVQEEYNKEHHITPQTVKKAVRDLISISKSVAETEEKLEKDPESMSRKELEKLIKEVEKKMRKAAADLNFEAAAGLRDKMVELKKNMEEMD